MTHREQTKAIKFALQEIGYPVTSVKHGTGTARSRIHIKLDIEWDHLNKIRDKVEQLAAETIGRDTWIDNYIIIN